MSTETPLNIQEPQTILNQKEDQGSTEQNEQHQRQQDQDLADPRTCEENDELPKNDIVQAAIEENQQTKIEGQKQIVQEEPERTLKKVKSEQELKIDFKQNQKMLTTLSFNIDDLFKKISSLTQEVQSQIGSKPLSSAKSIEKIQSPRKKYDPPSYKSQKLIELKQPILEPKFSYDSEKLNEKFDLSNEKMITMRMFEIGQSLGYGKFGEVVECKHKQTGFLFALKKIFKSTIYEYKMEDQLLIQLEACKRMNHPNIIKSYTSFTDDFHIFLITEYALGCKLTKKFNSPQQEVSKIIYQVLDALKFMHSQGVVHRDLKPQNILIDTAGTIKICDFGWSSLHQKGEKMNILCGTLDYVSPQMVAGQQYTKQVDLWSVGVLTYELIFGTAPFKAQNKAGTFQKVKNLQLTFPGAFRFSQECLDFIGKLLKPETERMRLQECFTHPFITNNQKTEKQNPDIDILFE